MKWHSLKDTINSKVEIVSLSPIDTSISPDKKTILLSQKLHVTCFDSGYFVIPPFKFLRNGDSLKYVETKPLLLEVIAFEVDTTQAIKDIKPPLEAPYTFKEALPYIIAGLLIVILVLVVIYYFNKRKATKIVVQPTEPKLSAHELALMQLKMLQEKKLWQQGNYKLYHTDLTDILRQYLQERFGVMALEQTTDEILKSFRSIDISDPLKSNLKQVLELADFVKFAKINPIASENELSMQHAVAFVNATAIKEQENEKQGGLA